MLGIGPAASCLCPLSMLPLLGVGVMGTIEGNPNLATVCVCGVGVGVGEQGILAVFSLKGVGVLCPRVSEWGWQGMASVRQSPGLS